MLHDRLLRPAMVGIAKTPAGAPPAQAAPANTTAERGGAIDEKA